MAQAATESSDAIQCEFCSLSFPSRNQVFKHLALKHPDVGLELDHSHKIKCALLVGYLPAVGSLGDKTEPLRSNDDLESCGGRALTWNDAKEDVFEHTIWRAIQQVTTKQAVVDFSSPPPRPLGWTRTTSTESRRSSFLSQPKATPSVSELVCCNLPPVADSEAWVQQLNTVLQSLATSPNSVASTGGDATAAANDEGGGGDEGDGLVMTVHGRVEVSPSTHAETHCDLRRYEVLVPLSVLSPHLSHLPLTAFDSISNTATRTSTATNSTTSTGSGGVDDTSEPSASSSKEEPWGGELQEVVTGWSGPWLDEFRRLKKVLQRFQGRFNWHNYSHGVLPHDAVAKTPKLLRFKHMSVVRYKAKSKQQQQEQGPPMANGEEGEPPLNPFDHAFVVLSVHGNMFLRGHVQGLVGMALAVMRGWLPSSSEADNTDSTDDDSTNQTCGQPIESSLRAGVVLTGAGSIPLVPQSSVYFAEGRFDSHENRRRVMLGPRWSREAKAHAAREVSNSGVGGGSGGDGDGGDGGGGDEGSIDGGGEGDQVAAVAVVAKKKRGKGKGRGANTVDNTVVGDANPPMKESGDWGEDWTCPSCAQVNFKRRLKCFKCKKKKVGADNSSNTDDGDDGDGVSTAAATAGAALAGPAPLTMYTGFVGDVAYRAKALGEQHREAVIKRLCTFEASQGEFKAWAIEHDRKATEMRTSFEKAVALAPPPPKYPPPPPPPPFPQSQDGDSGDGDGVGASAACGAGASVNRVGGEGEEESGGSVGVSENGTTRGPELMSAEVEAEVEAKVGAVYGRTLELLRRADASGKWPLNSATRARVIANAGPSTTYSYSSFADTDANNTSAATAAAASAPASAAAPTPLGGTFAVGSMPPPLELPRANNTFLDLMESAFELERALLPDRPPSSTIAINRHAQFTPHTDSGSGAGQSQSLIVGLGQFTGGELVVEGEVHDVRYKPLEFSGWTQRHWTLPFKGERFSLVWFTPRGCEEMPGLDLCRKMRTEAAEAAAAANVEASGPIN